MTEEQLKEVLLSIAQTTAFNHKEEHGYLPQTADESDVWQPHAWVLDALEMAFLWGRDVS